jgi:hypothetical protein
VKNVLLALFFSVLFLVGCNSNITARYPSTSLINSLNNATVQLQQKNLEGKYSTFCSGVWVSANKILTAKHCVKDDEHDEYTDAQLLGRNLYYLDYADSDTLHFPATDNPAPRVSTLIAVSANDDIALLYVIKDTDHSVATMAVSNPESNIPAWSLGHTIRLSYTLAPAWISAVRTFNLPGDEHAYQVIQSEGFAYKGNSGGGLYSTEGELLGICSFGASQFPGSSFWVPIKQVRKFLDESL